jgi:hypothetical protein
VPDRPPLRSPPGRARERDRRAGGAPLARAHRSPTVARTESWPRDPYRVIPRARRVVPLRAREHSQWTSEWTCSAGLVPADWGVWPMSFKLLGCAGAGGADVDPGAACTLDDWVEHAEAGGRLECHIDQR